MRYFTSEEANSLVPWLEVVLVQVSHLREELERSQERLLGLVRLSRANGVASKERELSEARQQAEEAHKRLEDSLGRITSRGILLRDMERGLVDFPSIREGREVYLCWLMGEPEVQFWHEVDAGFAGRQPL